MSTAAAAPSPAPAEPLVLVRAEGAMTRITLNRPRAINALSSEMFGILAHALRETRETAGASGSAAPRSILIDGAGDRGFCGGGDIKEIAGADPRGILALEYAVDHWIARSPLPVVVIMDGIAMGGGIGLGGHAAQRVVTERSRLAMPEVRIGIVPDVGGHLLLARAPGRLGELLAITAGEFGAADAIGLGFADWFVPSERIPELRAALAAGEAPAAACARHAEQPPGPAPILESAAWWDPIAEFALGAGAPGASATSAAPATSATPAAQGGAEAIAAAVRLLAALDASPVPAAAATAELVRGMCPASVVVTLAQLDRTRRLDLDLAAVLADDLRVLGRLAARPDFPEGVRAQVIDKDRSPAWCPATIAELEPAEVAAILDPELRDGEWALDLDPELPADPRG